MNKIQAAKFLGLSEKTIERYKSSGKLSARLKRVVGHDRKSRTVLDFDESDLEHLRRKLSGEVVYPISTDRHAQTNRQTNNDRQTQDNLVISESNKLEVVEQTQTTNFLEVIFKSFESFTEKSVQASNRSQKLLLNLNDCRILTGLSDSNLRDAIKSGKLKAKIIGRGYKIKRVDLDKFVKDL